VISNALIHFYESLVDRLTPVQIDPNFEEYATKIRAVWEARAILRDLRSRAGIATCSGQVDCVEVPTHHCIRGEHPTCLQHADFCYLCLPQRLADAMSAKAD
jgi:hypothetical protein